MDDIKILISAILDKVKSSLNIKKQLNELAQTPFFLSITAKIEKVKTQSQLNNELREISRELNSLTINTNIDSENVKKQIQNTLDGLNTKIDIDANVQGGEKLNEVSEGLDGINKRSIATVASVTLLHKALSGLEQAARKMVDTAINLDEKMTNLRMIEGMSYDDVRNLTNAYGDLGRELGAKISQTLDASNEWLRQGMSQAETSELIKQSLIFSKVAMVDSETATQNLTSAMRGYKMEVNEVVKITDSLTAVDSKAATTASDLATAMSYTASSASIANVSFNKLVGYIASVAEVSQRSSSSIGEFYKTLFSRINNVKLGKLIDDDGESISDVEKILSHFNIALRDTEDTFLSSETVLDSVASRWDEFTNVQQRAIAGAFAGTRQQELFLTLMSNYGKAIEYAGVAAESSGTSLKKFESYQSSISSKINTFVNAFEKFSMSSLDSGFIQDIIGAGTTLLDLLGNINTVLLLVSGTTLIIKRQKIADGIINIGDSVKGLYSKITALIPNTKAWTAAQTSTNASLATGTATAGALSAGIGLAMLAISGIIMAVNSYNESEKERIRIAKENSNALKAESDELETQKQKIIELRSELDKGNLSQSESYDKRKQLYQIQKNLIDQYGLESDSINLVTGAINDQIMAIDNLGKTNYDNFIRENKEAVDKAKQYFESESSKFITAPTVLTTFRVWDDDFRNQVSTLVEDIGGKFNDALLSSEKDITFFGSPQEVLKKYEDLFDAIIIGNKNATGELRKDTDNFLGDLSNRINALKTEIGNYQDIYAQYIEGLIKYDEKYSQEYIAVLKARADLEKAQYEGNEENIRTAQTALFEALKTGIEKAGDDVGIADYFRNMYLELQTEFNKYQFQLSFEVNENDLASKVENALKSLSDLKSDEIIQIGTTISEVGETGVSKEQAEAYKELTILADEYEIKVKDLINLLVLLGMIESSPVIETKPIDEYSNTLSNLIAKTSFLSKVITEQTANGKISAETYAALIAEGDDYAKLVEITKDGYILLTDKTKDYNNELVKQAIQTGITNKYTEEQISTLFNLLQTTTEVNNELSKSTSTLLSSAKTMSSAFAEMNENGKISLDTAFSLIEAGYTAALSFDTETGAIRINTEAYLRLTEAKINDQIISEKLALTEVSSRFANEITAVNGLTEAYYKNSTAAAENALIALEAAKATSYNTDKEKREIEARIKILEELRNSLGSVVSGEYGAKATSTKKETDLNKEAFETAYKELQRLRESANQNEKITQEQYLNKVEELYKKHFSNLSKYQDEYSKYELEVFKSRYDNFIDYLNDVEFGISQTARLNDTSDEQISAYEKLLSALQEKKQYYYDQGLTDEDDYIQSLIKKENGYADAIVKIYDESSDQRIKSLDKEYEKTNNLSVLRSSLVELSNKTNISDTQREKILDRIADTDEKISNEKLNFLKSIYKKTSDEVWLYSELVNLSNDENISAEQRLKIQKEINDLISEQNENVLSNINSFKSGIEQLNNAYKTLESGGKLSFSDITSLLEKYPDLIKKVKIDESGVASIGMKALEEAINNESDAFKKYIEDRKKLLKEAYTDTKKLYKIETDPVEKQRLAEEMALFNEEYKKISKLGKIDITVQVDDSFTRLNQELDNIQSAYNNVSKAIDEFNDKGLNIRSFNVNPIAQGCRVA